MKRMIYLAVATLVTTVMTVVPAAAQGENIQQALQQAQEKVQQAQQYMESPEGQQALQEAQDNLQQAIDNAQENLQSPEVQQALEQARQLAQEKVQAAAAFVKFMSSAESQAFVAEKVGLLPARKSAYDLPAVKDNATIAAFKPVVDAAIARPWIPEGGQFFGPMDKMAVEVLVQNKDPKASLDAVAKTYKAEVVRDYTS